jgi:hypothetical protein
MQNARLAVSAHSFEGEQPSAPYSSHEAANSNTRYRHLTRTRPPLSMAEAAAVADWSSTEECTTATAASPHLVLGLPYLKVRRPAHSTSLPTYDTQSPRISSCAHPDGNNGLHMAAAKTIGLSSRPYVTPRLLSWQLTTGEHSRAALGCHSQLLNPPSPAVRPAIRFTGPPLMK